METEIVVLEMPIERAQEYLRKATNKINGSENMQNQKQEPIITKEDMKTYLKNREPTEKQKRRDMIEFFVLKLKNDLQKEGVPESVINDGFTLSWLLERAKEHFEKKSTEDIESLYESVKS